MISNTTTVSGQPVFNTRPSSTTEEIQDNFYKVLTAQLQNQNPLEPMDNSEMTAQLTQINILAQLEQLNLTVAQIAERNLLDPIEEIQTPGEQS